MFDKLNNFHARPYVADIPGSKSYTNRALILAAQRVGRTVIKGALICDDTVYLATALNSFGGIEVVQDGNSFTVMRQSAEIWAPTDPLYVGGAGTPARLLLSFATTAKGVTTVIGNDRLNARPMDDLLEAFGRIGVTYKCLKEKFRLPVAVTGGELAEKKWSVDGGVSSQFVTSLLLLAAQQKHGQDITIEVMGHIVSRSYIDMTISMMKEVGIRACWVDQSSLNVSPSLPSSAEISIEPDASAMSYLLAAAAITRTTVVIPGIGLSSCQGDLGLVHAFQQMGCSVTIEQNSVTLTGAELSGIEIDMCLMPDVVLSLAIVASQANSPTKITNIANLRVKECDRISAISTELNRLGITVEEGPDWLLIYPGRPNPYVCTSTYDDHRVAMSFSLLGLLYTGITLEDYECVSKSFPNYWNEMYRFCEHHNNAVSAPLTAA